MENLLKTMFEKKDHEKKVVVITGASAGVGRATAREFARKGYKITLIARGKEGLEATKQEVEQLGGEALIFPADVADYTQLEQAAVRTEDFFGPIDVWVNNAMTSVFSPVKEMQPDEYKRVTEVTFLGQVYGAQAALKRMLPRDKGIIIFVGSALAYRGIPLQSAYCAAKHAVQGFFGSLRTELIHDKSKVRISMVQLPAMNTPQFDWVKSRLSHRARPMGKIYQPEVAARAILYASGHKRREIYVGTPTVEAIVGNKIAPWAGDLLLAESGFKGQQTKEPENPDRPNNLWKPVGGDHGAHGRFGEKAHKNSKELWMSMNKLKVIAGAAVAATALGVTLGNPRKAIRRRRGFSKQVDGVIVVEQY